MKTSDKAKLPGLATRRKERKENTVNEGIFRIQPLECYYTKLLSLHHVAQNYRFQ